MKERKLTNIYAGRKLSVVLKKQEDGSNTIVNLVYPVNNTLSIEVRKVQNSFNIKEYSDKNPFINSCNALFHWAPIAEELKELDKEIVINSIKNKWMLVVADLEKIPVNLK